MVIPFFDCYPYKIIQNILTHYEKYHLEAYESGWCFQHLRKYEFVSWDDCSIPNGK